MLGRRWSDTNFYFSYGNTNTYSRDAATNIMRLDPISKTVFANKFSGDGSLMTGISESSVTSLTNDLASKLQINGNDATAYAAMGLALGVNTNVVILSGAGTAAANTNYTWNSGSNAYVSPSIALLTNQNGFWFPLSGF